MSNRPECLVIRRGGLGDTLLMLPVIAALRRAMPAANICFAGVREYGEVLQWGGSVDRVVSSESLQLWTLHTDKGLPAAVQTQLIQCVGFVCDDPILLRARLPARVLTMDPRPVDTRPLAVQIGAQLGLDVDLSDAVLRPPRLCNTDSALFLGLPSQVDAVLSPVVLAPGSGGVSKCWPREHWLELAAWIASIGVPIAVVVGPTEIERSDPRRWPWPDATVFWDSCTCRELATKLAQARAFVGNDSGVTHLAGALEVPTLALFGPTDPRIWAPPQRNVRVLQWGGMDVGVPKVRLADVCEQLHQLIR